MFNNNDILTGLIGLTGLLDHSRCRIEWPFQGRLVMTMTMDRRRFVQVMAAGMVTAVTSWGCADNRDDIRDLAQPALLEMTSSSQRPAKSWR